MNIPESPSVVGNKTLHAEFDMLADEYHEQHKAVVAMTGEGPEYFAEYKIANLASFVARQGIKADTIMDFGSGIGNSVPFFYKYFEQSKLNCCDVSARSLEIAQARFMGSASYIQIGDGVPLPSDSQDLVFSACVFHHIPHDEHTRWLCELKRVTRPGGALAIYEHNPLNPLTVHAVNTCPFDVNAHLIRAGEMRRRALSSGWEDARISYNLFFPSLLNTLRPLEPYLGWLCLGAQYSVIARKPS